jgi:hypothetical protein
MHTHMAAFCRPSFMSVLPYPIGWGVAEAALAAAAMPVRLRCCSSLMVGSDLICIMT